MSDANREQIEYWNETSGPKWVQLADRVEPQIAPLGLAALEALGLQPGERVLDVGCGCGDSSLQIGERVGPEGQVLGADISGPMLEEARRRACDAGVTHVRFEQADAQVHPFEADAFDAVFSRFGIMFFEDPVAAFANLHRALRPGGRMGFVCWQELPRNPWMLRPVAAVAALIELPPRPDPHAPGPFAFADAERVRGLLEKAGFEDVEVESMERDLLVGGGSSLDETVEFLLQMGPAGAALREAGADVRARAAVAVREAVEPFATAEGIRMPSASWRFGARRAG
jgi:SAM-dependent methyltransferase